MLITINGQPREVDLKSTIEELIQQLQLQGQRLAVEVNKEVIVRSRHNSFTLSEGDQVEIINAVGGG
ncbi:MAG: sulfur carrier protein ThiS [Pseudomonadota bacterium]